MHMVFPPAPVACNSSTRTDFRISSAVLPVNASACSMLTNSTSAPQLSHRVRVNDPHWRMIQTRSRSTVMRVILLLAKPPDLCFLGLQNRDKVRPERVRSGAMRDNFAGTGAESPVKILKKS